MRVIRIAAAAIVMAILGACGTQPQPPNSSHNGPGRPACPSGDSVTQKDPAVDLEPPRTNGLHPLPPGSSKLGCGAWVEANGASAAATLNYGRTAQCELTQIPNAGQAAYLQSRDPLKYLFNLDPGQIQCTFTGSPTLVWFCGKGYVSPNGQSQILGRCQKDPLFFVEVYAGSVTVTNPRGVPKTVTAGGLLQYDFTTGVSQPGQANFTPDERRVFSEQAQALGLELAPPPTSAPASTSPSSGAPASVSPSTSAPSTQPIS